MKTDNQMRINVMASSVKKQARTKDEPCEDAYCYKILDNGTLLAAVADGAGSKSAPWAALGARVAVNAAIEFLEVDQDIWVCQECHFVEEQWKAKMGLVFKQVLTKMSLEANTYQVDISSLATTLLLVAATPHGIAFGQIGDGGIVGLKNKPKRSKQDPSQTKLIKLNEGHKGRYANETVFITSKGALDKVKSGYIAGDFCGVALFTDGLEHIALDPKTNFPRESFLMPLLEITTNSRNGFFNKKLRQFLEGPYIQSRTIDDLTLLIGTVDSWDSSKQSQAKESPEILSRNQTSEIVQEDLQLT